MPGRLLALVRHPASSATKFDIKAQQHPSLAPPPLYSVNPPQKKSHESLSMDAIKRHSIGGGHKKSPKVEPHKAAKMNMVVESPPLVFYGPPQGSTGALFSGQLVVNVVEPHATFQTFEMQLLATVTTKKPVVQHCPECSSQTTKIHTWNFLKGPTSLRHGEHDFPFSHLLPGHLPASTHGALATLDYHLHAVATMSTGEKITYDRSIVIKRAIIPGNDKHSIRIFPPTNLTAAVKLPPVVHPIGDFPLELRLSGITMNKGDSQTRWRLRKLNWRIEETMKFVAPACNKHAQKVGGEGKGVMHEDVRVIATDEVKHGWKTDFEAGNIECEFSAAPNPALKPLCDMESPSGMDVKHNLVIEMVVAEEWAPLKKPNQATPTGAARVLRTQFHLIMTERAGMGISWDEEQPPMYEDVPASPPTYMEDIDLASLEDHVDHLNLY